MLITRSSAFVPFTIPLRVGVTTRKQDRQNAFYDLVTIQLEEKIIMHFMILFYQNDCFRNSHQKQIEPSKHRFYDMQIALYNLNIKIIVLLFLHIRNWHKNIHIKWCVAPRKRNRKIVLKCGRKYPMKITFKSWNIIFSSS